LCHLWLRLNHKVLDVALLRLWLCSIAAAKSDPNLSAILSNLFLLDSLMPEKCDNPSTVTIQQRSICEKEVCEVYWCVHEQADDEADGALLNSYGFFTDSTSTAEKSR
jgi:hypothetical protein